MVTTPLDDNVKPAGEATGSVDSALVDNLYEILLPSGSEPGILKEAADCPIDMNTIFGKALTGGLL